MGCDQESGAIRKLTEGEKVKELESVFTVGEIIEVKECHFKVVEIQPNPINRIIFEGVAKLEADTEPSGVGPGPLARPTTPGPGAE